MSLIILITGGSGGLGRMISEYFINKGHFVYVLDKVRTVEIESAFKESLAGYLECDLGNTQDLLDCFTKLVEKIQRVDILINNASVRQFKKLEDFQLVEIVRNINVDYVGPVILSKLCLPIMKKNNFGRIINISSISALQGYSTGTLYCSNKQALITLQKCLSRELAHLKGMITINTICPDSFTKADGTALKTHRKITTSIISNIVKAIESSKKSRIIYLFTSRKKLIISLLYFKQVFRILTS